MKVKLASIWRLYSLIYDRFPATGGTLTAFLSAYNELADQRGVKRLTNARLTLLRHWREGVDDAAYSNGIYHPRSVRPEEMQLFLEVLACEPDELFDSKLLISRYPAYDVSSPPRKTRVLERSSTVKKNQVTCA